MNKSISSKAPRGPLKISTLSVLVMALFAAVLILAPRASADSNPATSPMTMTCSATPAVTGTTVTDSGVQGLVQGEVVEFATEVSFEPGDIFQEIITRPDGTTYYASYIEISKLTSNLEVVDPVNPVTLTINGADTTLTPGTAPQLGGFVFHDDGGSYKVYFPGDPSAEQDGSGVASYTVTDNPTVFRLGLKLRVPTTEAIGNVLDGVECFATVSTGPSNRDTDRPRVSVVVLEPNVVIEKTTNPDNAYFNGQLAKFDITVSAENVDVANQRSYSNPKNVQIVDQVPAGLVPVDIDEQPLGDGVTTVGGGIWDATARTITYTVGDMDAEQSDPTLPEANIKTFTEHFHIAPDAVVGSTVSNKACVNFSNQGLDENGDPIPGDVRVAGDDTNGYCTTSEVTVASKDPTITKQALRTATGPELQRYGHGLDYFYKVDVALPANSRYYNLTISDLLPDGVEFVDYESATCAPAGPTCVNPITTLAPSVSTDGSTSRAGWYANLLPEDLNPRTITLVYKVRLKPEYSTSTPLAFNDTFTNTATVHYNNVDRLGSVAPVTEALPVFDGEVSATSTITYSRPQLEVNKQVTTSDNVESGHPGSSVTRPAWNYDESKHADYLIEVTNVGSIPAVSTTIEDTPAGIEIAPATLTLNGAACPTTCSVDATTGKLTVTYPDAIAVGETVKITYRAKPTASGDIDNTAAVPTYHDETSDTDPAPFTEYTENPTDTVPLKIPDPVVTLTKTTLQKTVARTRGTRIPFEFTVTNTGSVTAYNVVVEEIERTPRAYDFKDIAMSDPVSPGGLDSSASAVGVSATAAGKWKLDAPLAPGDSVTFKAWIEITGNPAEIEYTNEARVIWEDLTDNLAVTGGAYEHKATSKFEVAPPKFEVSKAPRIQDEASIQWSVDTNEDGTLEESELKEGEWQITVRNTGPSPIGGLIVTDTMPDPFKYTPNSATTTWVGQPAPSAGFVDNSTEDGATPWPTRTRELNFSLPQIEPGARVVINVPFIHTGEAPADGDLQRINTVKVENPLITTSAPEHQAQAAYTLIPPEASPEIVKTVKRAGTTDPFTDIADASPGDELDFKLTMTIPTQVTTGFHDLWLYDELPDGMSLVNTPTTGTIPNSAPTGWTVTCITGCATGASAGGEFIGTSTSANNTTLGWWFDEVAPDATETPIVYEVTFRAKVDVAFSSGDKVQDGFDEPLVNKASPVYNRATGLNPAGQGNVIDTRPTTVPDPDTFERIVFRDTAKVDIKTPRLELTKKVFNTAGQEISEINAGETFEYRVTITNTGSGPAHLIKFQDTLGTPPEHLEANFMTWEPTSLTSIPAPDGGSCNTYDPDTTQPGSAEHLECNYAGPLAPGSSIEITYKATTVPAPDFYAQTSTNNFDPMIIRNTARTVEYYESAAGGNKYETGAAFARLFAYTPVPEMDVVCRNPESFVDAPPGKIVQFYVEVGNGDRIDHGSNADGDKTLTPPPLEDLDGDGYPEAAMGYDPEMRLFVPSHLELVGIQATGPGVGDPNYATYVDFAAADETLPAADGSGTTYVWNTLANIPHSPQHFKQQDFKPWYKLNVDVRKTQAGGGHMGYELTLKDSQGNLERGQNVGEPFKFIEKGAGGCPGPGGPRVWKYPDVEDNVQLSPGDTTEFIIKLRQPLDTDQPSVFTDVLPNGLIYAGDLPTTDTRHGVATISPSPTSWASAPGASSPEAKLQDFFVSSTTDSNGNTTLKWDPPPLPKAPTTAPDELWTITIPVVVPDNPPVPNTFLTNRFIWDVDGSPYVDTGAVYVIGLGKPSMSKRAVNSVGAYGGTFEYVLDVTIPANFAGSDVFIYDEINRVGNWNSVYDAQAGSSSWVDPRFIFPADTVPAVAPPTHASGGLRYYNYAATPAEMQLEDYTSEVCVVNCGAPGSSTYIPVVPLPPAEFSTGPGQVPFSSNYSERFYQQSNGAVGWYLGDITAHNAERKLRLRYTVKAPTLLEQRQRVVELNGATGFSATDPSFDKVDSFWFKALSRVRHPNLAFLRTFSSDNAVLGAWEGKSRTAWKDPGANNAWATETGSVVRAYADEVVEVTYPIVEMDKTCGAVGATDDPLKISLPKMPAVGSDNVECTIKVTNKSPITAHGVEVVDDPMTQCVMGAVSINGELTYAGSLITSNPWDPAVSPPGSGANDPKDPKTIKYDCLDGAPNFQTPTAGTVTPAGGFPFTWSLDLEPGKTETFTYSLRIDGWTNQPKSVRTPYEATWDYSGYWANDATLKQWKASASPTAELIGEEQTTSGNAVFQDTYANISTQAFPAARNVCVNTSPFPDWKNNEQAHFYPFLYAVSGNLFNAGHWHSTRHVGYPYTGDYWNNFADRCETPLYPPSAIIIGFTQPWSVRGVALGAFNPTAVYNTWAGFATGRDWHTSPYGFWKRPATDESNWDPAWNAYPEETYTWALNIRIDGLNYATEMQVEDWLPLGWQYIDGSARIVEGNWRLGQGETVGTPTDIGVREWPISDPTKTAFTPATSSGGRCRAPHDSGTIDGQHLTWDFRRDGAGHGNDPWLNKYVDVSKAKALDGTVTSGRGHYNYPTGSTGYTDHQTWIRIHFDAKADLSVMNCDPDPADPKRFMQENNARLTLLHENPIQGDSGQQITNSNWLVPISDGVAFSKTPDDGVTRDNTTAEFEITFTNNLTVAVEDLQISDTLSASLPPLPGGGYVCGSATATLGTNPDTAPVMTPALSTVETCAGAPAQNQTFSWTIPSIPAGETITIKVPIVIPDDETNTLVWNNFATTTVKEFFNRPFSDNARIMVVNPSQAPTVTKTVTPALATVNDEVIYEIEVPVKARQIFIDMGYIDELPDGLTFIEYLDITCSGVCPHGYSPSDITKVPRRVNADGSTTLMWWFGDVPGSTGASTWKLRYKARVDTTFNNGDDIVTGAVLSNTVRGYALPENQYDTVPATIPTDPQTYWQNPEPDFDPATVAMSVAALNIGEPKLEITKTATPTGAVNETSVIPYEITVTNSGTFTAHNITVEDTPLTALENLVQNPIPAPAATPVAGDYSNSDYVQITEGWTAIAPTISWYVKELPPGQSAVLKYTGEVADNYFMDGVTEAINEAAIPTYYGRGGTTQDANDREYGGAKVENKVPLASPEIDINTTVNGCGTQDHAWVETGQRVDWCLTVSNTGQAGAGQVKVVNKVPYGWTYEPGSTAITSTGTAMATVEPTVTTVNGLQTLTWIIPALPDDSNVKIAFKAKPGEDASEVSTNWAYAQQQDASGNDLPPVVTKARHRDPAQASTGQYGLEISKTPNRQEWPHLPAANKDETTWTITITNPPPPAPREGATLNNVKVLDSLPSPLEYKSQSSTDTRVTFDGAGALGSGLGSTQPLNWTITNIAPGETIAIEVTATNNGTETEDQWYVNDVQATSDEILDEVVNIARVKYYTPAVVGDYVWEDTNNDGIQDTSETGVNGVKVNLLDESGNPIYRNNDTGVILKHADWIALSLEERTKYPAVTTITANDPTTGAAGWYNFDFLRPGNYQIEFEPPLGYAIGKDNVADATDETDSDANRFTGRTHIFTLTKGQTDLSVDAALVTTAQYNAEIASVDIEKYTHGIDADDPHGPALKPGDPVTWTYKVTNNGWTALKDVTVTDDEEGAANCDVDANGSWDGTNIITLLKPGQTRWCSISSTVPTTGVEGYANTATAVGDPVMPDLTAAGVDPFKPSTWPNDIAFYTAANGADATPLQQVEATDKSHYFANKAKIDIIKKTNGVDADDTTGPEISVHAPVTWTYDVTNTGNMVLINALVEDDQGVSVFCDNNGDGEFSPPDSATIPILLPGHKMRCQGTGTATGGAYTNVATVKATPVLPKLGTNIDMADSTTLTENVADYEVAQTPTFDADGNLVRDPNGDVVTKNVDDVSAEDDSRYFGIQEAIDIEKATNTADADEAPGPVIKPGEDVVWTYVVTNSGNTAMGSVTVVDDQGVTVVCDTNRSGTFDASEDNTIDLILPNGSYTCQGTGAAVAGPYKNNATVTATPMVPAQGSGIDPSNPSSWPDDITKFENAQTIQTDANGNPVLDGSGNPILENVPPISDDDPSHYFGDDASVGIEKATNGVDADLPAGPVIKPGKDVVWTYVVTNNSLAALTAVEVTDNKNVAVTCDIDGDGTFAATEGNTIEVLAPGASVTCQGKGEAKRGQYSNIGNVTGVVSLPKPAPGVDLSDKRTWPTDPTGYAPAQKIATGADGQPRTDSNGNAILEDHPPVEADDPSHYFGGDGELSIEKATNTIDADEAPGPVIKPGDPVIWTYVVTNASTYALRNVKISDDQPVTVICDVDGDGEFGTTPPDGDTLPLMAPGASVLCKAAGVAQAGPYKNIGSVTGEPVTPKPSPDVDPSDPSTWPTDPTAYEPAKQIELDGNGNPVLDVDGDPILEPVPTFTDDDPSHYFGDDTRIHIEKSTNGHDSDNAPGRAITIGGDVVWQYTVTNHSKLALRNVQIVDDQGVEVRCDTNGDGNYNSGAQLDVVLPETEITCQGTGSAQAGQYKNLATVTGEPVAPPIGNPAHPDVDITDPTTWPNDPTVYEIVTRIVTDENSNPVLGPDGKAQTEPVRPLSDDDPSHYFGTDGGIDVVKTTNGIDAKTPTGPALTPGENVTWTYTVTNTTETALTNVTVTDTRSVPVDCGDTTNTIAVLLPAATHTCVATGTAEAGQYQNGVTVTGEPSIPNPDTCGCDLTDTTTWPTQDITKYTPALDENSTVLPPVTGVDESHYYGANPKVEIEKATNGIDADEAPGVNVAAGTDIEWTYVVANTGNTALANVHVTDDQGVVVSCAGGNPIALMRPGQKVTCSGNGVAEPGQYKNIGQVGSEMKLPDAQTCGCDITDPTTWPTEPSKYVTPVVVETDANGDIKTDASGTPITKQPPAVTASDPSHYRAATGGLTLEKHTNGADSDNAPGETIVGQIVTWTYMVTNESNYAILDIEVTDDTETGIDCGDGTNKIALLSPGETHTCSLSQPAKFGQYVNIGTAKGKGAIPNLETCNCTLEDFNSWPDKPEYYIFLKVQGTGVESYADSDASHYVGNPQDPVKRVPQPDPWTPPTKQPEPTKTPIAKLPIIGRLVHTGSETNIMMSLSMFFVSVGAAMVGAARRRRKYHDKDSH